MPSPLSKLLSLACLVGLTACSSSSVLEFPPDAAMPDAAVPDAAMPDSGPTLDAGFDAGSEDAGFDAGPPPALTMADCLEAGGELEGVHTINNNDTREHGPILTFAVSEERQIAVSTLDATLKFWTLDAFQGETGLAQLSYGPEIVATSVALDFWDETVVAGDSQGVIASWSPEFGMQQVLGGTDPGTSLVALAVDAEAGLLAQSDATGTLVVRPLPGFEGETAQLPGVNAADLAWSNGLLYLVTADGVEARDASLSLVAEAPVSGAQFVHAEGDTIAVGDDGHVRLFDGSLEQTRGIFGSFVPPPLRGISLAESFPVLLFAGDAPSVEVQLSGIGESRIVRFAFEALGDEARVPVEVVADPQGELLFVAFEDGFVEILACAPSAIPHGP